MKTKKTTNGNFNKLNFLFSRWIAVSCYIVFIVTSLLFILTIILPVIQTITYGIPIYDRNGIRLM